MNDLRLNWLLPLLVMLSISIAVVVVVSCIISFAGNSFRNPISISNKRLCEKSFVRYVRVASSMSSVERRLQQSAPIARLLDDDLPLMDDCRVPTQAHARTQVSMLHTHTHMHVCMYAFVCCSGEVICW